MSKKKILILVSVMLIVVGCCAAFLGFMFNGRNINFEANPLPENEMNISDRVDEVEISVLHETVLIEPVEGNNFVLRYKGYFSISLYRDAILGIRRNYVQEKWSDNFGIYLGNEPEVYLGVPDKFHGDITISSDSGDIIIDGIELDRPLIIKTEAGEISVEDMDVEQLILESQSGDIGVDSVSVEYSSKISAQSGSIDIDTLSGVVIETKASSGDVRMENCTADNISVRTSSGDIELEDCGCNESIYLEAESGSIDGKLSDSRDEYSIYSSTNSGSNNLPEEKENGSKILNVKTSSADIDITFKRQ